MLIFLVGYMGCGKSSRGKELARALSWEFIDMDHYIVDTTGKTINELFDELGEDGFRKLEKETLHDLFGKKNTIIGTGGGAPCFFDNMEQMNQHGTTVYLKMSPPDLVSRLSKGKWKRPLIKDKTDEELLVFIEENIGKREPFYSKAKMVVEGKGLTGEMLRTYLEV